jgi:hypothetical protein
MTAIPLAFLVVGIAWPHGAWMLLRILVATVALGYVVFRLYAAGLPERTTHDTYSPFDALVGERPRPVAPPAIGALAAQLGAADDGSAETTPIPWPIARTLIRDAAGRLADRHALSLGERAHVPAIRALVSEATWLLIDPVGSGPSSPHLEYRAVPLSRLDTILDDLESL